MVIIIMIIILFHEGNTFTNKLCYLLWPSEITTVPLIGPSSFFAAVAAPAVAGLARAVLPLEDTELLVGLPLESAWLNRVTAWRVRLLLDEAAVATILQHKHHTYLILLMFRR